MLNVMITIINDQMILAGVEQRYKIYQDFANHAISISKGLLFIMRVKNYGKRFN